MNRRLFFSIAIAPLLACTGCGALFVHEAATTVYIAGPWTPASDVVIQNYFDYFVDAQIYAYTGELILELYGIPPRSASTYIFLEQGEYVIKYVLAGTKEKKKLKFWVPAIGHQEYHDGYNYNLARKVVRLR